MLCAEDKQVSRPRRWHAVPSHPQRLPTATPTSSRILTALGAHCAVARVSPQAGPTAPQALTIPSFQLIHLPLLFILRPFSWKCSMTDVLLSGPPLLVTVTGQRRQGHRCCTRSAPGGQSGRREPFIPFSAREFISGSAPHPGPGHQPWEWLRAAGRKRRDECHWLVPKCPNTQNVFLTLFLF